MFPYKVIPEHIKLNSHHANNIQEKKTQIRLKGSNRVLTTQSPNTRSYFPWTRQFKSIRIPALFAALPVHVVKNYTQTRTNLFLDFDHRICKTTRCHAISLLGYPCATAWSPALIIVFPVFLFAIKHHVAILICIRDVTWANPSGHSPRWLVSGSLICIQPMTTLSGSVRGGGHRR